MNYNTEKTEHQCKPSWFFKEVNKLISPLLILMQISERGRKGERPTIIDTKSLQISQILG